MRFGFACNWVCDRAIAMNCGANTVLMQHTPVWWWHFFFSFGYSNFYLLFFCKRNSSSSLTNFLSSWIQSAFHLKKSAVTFYYELFLPMKTLKEMWFFTLSNSYIEFGNMMWNCLWNFEYVISGRKYEQDGWASDVDFTLVHYGSNNHWYDQYPVLFCLTMAK